MKQPPPPHKWTYASAFLYSLTLITTIGKLWGILTGSGVYAFYGMCLLNVFLPLAISYVNYCDMKNMKKYEYLGMNFWELNMNEWGTTHKLQGKILHDTL